MASPGPRSKHGLPHDDSPKAEANVLSSALDVLEREAREIDPEVNRRVLRKIDWFLMPAMTIG